MSIRYAVLVGREMDTEEKKNFYANVSMVKQVCKYARMEIT